MGVEVRIKIGYFLADQVRTLGQADQLKGLLLVLGHAFHIFSCGLRLFELGELGQLGDEFRIIDRLENKELVTRNKKIGDRRISLIGLTEKGKELGQSLPDPTEEKLILGLADLEPTEIYGIYSAVEKILDLVDAKDLSDVPLDPSIITIPISDLEE